MSGGSGSDESVAGTTDGRQWVMGVVFRRRGRRAPVEPPDPLVARNIRIFRTLATKSCSGSWTVGTYTGEFQLAMSHLPLG